MLSWLVGAVLISLVLSYVKYWFSYWQRLGFPALPPVVPIGCLGPVLLKRQGMGELVRDIHLNSKEAVLGIYLLFQPALIIRDPVLLKRIFTSDFEHFTDRGVHCDEVNDPIGAHLFAMPGQAWKELRAKLSPTFSSGKIKYMFQTVLEKGNGLKELLNQEVEGGAQKVHMKRLLVKLNMNIIASVFFGFELDVFADGAHPFAKIGDVFMDPNIMRNNIIWFLFFLCPSLMQKLKIPFLSPEVSQYVMHLFNSVLEARKNDPSLKRNDFIQTVLELMEQDKKESDATGRKPKLSVGKCAAQAFVFYMGGYETSASSASYCLWALCKNPQWMKNVREEVDEVMREGNGKLQYEDIAKLNVLDQCIKEANRMYPVFPFLNRVCTEEYPVPDSELVIPKGTPIFISTFGLHMDPEYFPDPNTYDPSRFVDDAAADSLPYYPVRVKLIVVKFGAERLFVLLQFGAGPRYCIGARLGSMMVKMALCMLVYNFDFEAVDEKLEFMSSGFLLTDKNNIHLKISKRRK